MAHKRAWNCYYKGHEYRWTIVRREPTIIYLWGCRWCAWNYSYEIREVNGKHRRFKIPLEKQMTKWDNPTRSKNMERRKENEI